jgi:hypothetical protein
MRTDRHVPARLPSNTSPPARSLQVRLRRQPESKLILEPIKLRNTAAHSSLSQRHFAQLPGPTSLSAAVVDRSLNDPRSTCATNLNSDCVLKSQRNPTQSRSACRSIVGLCIFLLGLSGSASSSAASEPAPPATNGSSSASSSESGEAKTSTPVVSVTGTIAGDSALNQTPFANEESPSFVASFAPAPGTTPPTTNQVSPGPDAAEKAEGRKRGRKREGGKGGRKRGRSSFY